MRTFQYQHVTVSAGWQRDPRGMDPGQHFTLTIAGPGDVWLSNLESYYDFDEEAPDVSIGFTLRHIEQRLAARGIVAPAGFMAEVLGDAQANRESSHG